MPLSDLLTVFGGKTGYLINTRNICAHRPTVAVGYTGQNGKLRNENVKVKTKCGGKKNKKVRRHRRR